MHHLEQCQQVAASLTDEYQPLMWSFYKSHRRALFQLVRSLPISSTTQDQVLITALNFILAQENRRSLFLPDTLDLSFAPEVWQHLIRVKRKKRTKLARRHLEACIFAAVADELKAGDLAVEGSERRFGRAVCITQKETLFLFLLVFPLSYFYTYLGSGSYS